jgi:hypothetical protein
MLFGVLVYQYQTNGRTFGFFTSPPPRGDRTKQTKPLVFPGGLHLVLRSRGPAIALVSGQDKDAPKRRCLRHTPCRQARPTPSDRRARRARGDGAAAAAPVAELLKMPKRL